MESVSLVPGRVGTDNDSDHHYTLLGTEEANQAISSNLKIIIIFTVVNSKVTKQPYDSHSVF